MPRGYANYDFVVDSSFRPYTFAEMIQPFAIYKDAYEKAEAQYEDIANQDIMKYLSNLPEGSRSRDIYDNYMNEFNKQSEDFSKHGLNMSNRKALTNLRKRYKSEIGRLEAANTAMQEEKKLRRQMNAKDSSMLYATDNMSLDEFLDGATPNLYNISGTELYTRGAAAGKAASSRVYSAGDEGSTLGGYYRKWVERNGYSKESMDAFRANASAIPELQQAVDNILTERGVNDNLTGANLERARQSVLNGIIDGAIYQEKVNPVRDAGVMSAAEKASDDRARQSLQLQKDKFDYEKATSGITINNDGTVSYDPSKDAAYQRMKVLAGEGGMNGYKINPVTGKYVKDTEAAANASKEAKTNTAKEVELLKLDQATLANNDGFDVTFGGSSGLPSDRHHYNYIGAISKHGNKWHHGAIGEDNPGHWGWGFMSTSNVENAWGNFSAEGSDADRFMPGGKAKMRILAPSEFASLIQQDSTILEAIEERCKAAGVDSSTADIQIVEVPNERGGGDQKGYLIAVH